MGAGMTCDDKVAEKVRELLQENGVPASLDQARSLVAHLELVLEKNQVMNLTRIDSLEEGAVLHLLDSLLFLPAVEATEGPVLDIGTGAGFPGIPLALMTDHRFVLMDSVRKKVNAVAEFADALSLSPRVSVTSERAEAYALSHRGEFGAVVARAVASLPVLVEYAQPLLRRGGSLVVSKGRLSDDEMAAGLQAAKKVGLTLVSRETFELPEDMGHREILVFKKDRRSTVKLPRAVGEAKRNPLA